MQRYEYKVVPGPRKADKAKGLKTSEDRFAYTLTTLMNGLGKEGWEYQRSDTLPCEERVGLTGTKTSFQTVLVFRRDVDISAMEQAPVLLASPAQVSAPPPVQPPTPSIPVLRVGAAEAPQGAAPSLGPAKSDLAAE